jgi:hypothetical protein
MKFREANSLSDAELAEVLDFADTVSGWVKSVRSEAYRRAVQRSGCIPGYKTSEGKASRDWSIPPEEVPQRISGIAPDISIDDLYERSLKSVPQVEALLKSRFKGRGHKEVWDKFKKLLKKTNSASLSLVRDTDGRPEVRRGHEFAEIAKKAMTVTTDMEDLL